MFQTSDRLIKSISHLYVIVMYEIPKMRFIKMYGILVLRNIVFVLEMSQTISERLISAALLAQSQSNISVICLLLPGAVV